MELYLCHALSRGVTSTGKYLFDSFWYLRPYKSYHVSRQLMSSSWEWDWRRPMQISVASCLLSFYKQKSGRESDSSAIYSRYVLLTLYSIPTDIWWCHHTQIPPWTARWCCTTGLLRSKDPDTSIGSPGHWTPLCVLGEGFKKVTILSRTRVSICFPMQVLIIRYDKRIRSTWPWEGLTIRRLGHMCILIG